ADRRTLLAEVDRPCPEAAVPEIAKHRAHAPVEGDRIGAVGEGRGIRVGEKVPEFAVDEVADVRDLRCVGVDSRVVLDVIALQGHTLNSRGLGKSRDRERERQDGEEGETPEDPARMHWVMPASAVRYFGEREP